MLLSSVVARQLNGDAAPPPEVLRKTFEVVAAEADEQFAENAQRHDDLKDHIDAQCQALSDEITDQHQALRVEFEEQVARVSRLLLTTILSTLSAAVVGVVFTVVSAVG